MFGFNEWRVFKTSRINGFVQVFFIQIYDPRNSQVFDFWPFFKLFEYSTLPNFRTLFFHMGYFGFNATNGLWKAHLIMWLLPNFSATKIYGHKKSQSFEFWPFLLEVFHISRELPSQIWGNLVQITGWVISFCITYFFTQKAMILGNAKFLFSRSLFGFLSTTILQSLIS